MIYRLKTIIISLAIVLVGSMYLVASSPQTAAACGGTPSLIFIDPWTSAFSKCDNQGNPQITQFSDFFGLITWVVASLLKLSSYIALAYLIWGGVKYIKSQGNASAISEAKNAILQAIAGFVICLVAASIVQFVAGAF